MRPITASDLMNPEVLRLRGDQTLRAAAAFLVEREISGAPVEDETGTIVGVISLADVAAVVAGQKGAPPVPGMDEAADEPHDTDAADEDEAEGEGDEDDDDPLDETLSGEGGDPGDPEGDGYPLLVRDVMTVGVVSVPEYASVQEVAEKLLHGHVHRLLVTRGTEVVGIVSTSDLLGLLLIEEPWR